MIINLIPDPNPIVAVIKLANLPSMIKRWVKTNIDKKRIDFLYGKLSELKLGFKELLIEPNSDQIELEHQYKLMETHIQRLIHSIKDKYQHESVKMLPNTIELTNNDILLGEKE